MNTQAPKQSAADELIGRIINDRFRIISVIARGGMGRVYRAEQVPLGRLVAIKTLDPRGHGGDNDPQFQQRFFLEASVASKLQHPNTVTVFDYGRTSDGVYFIAMELVEGRSLFHVIRDDAPLPPARVIHVALQIARSLREAHRLDVIHRDLKPGNVLLTHHGDEEDFVKVLDFGLVKHVETEAEQELTKAGLFMGSPKYMSPEQIRGERVDARSDIYALGVVMYEMITGRVPFERDNTVKVLMAHMHEQVPPITTPDVPQPLVDLVMRCLDKRPDGRPASMDEVILRLKQAMGLSLTTSGSFALGSDMRLPPLSAQTGRIPTLAGGQYRPGAYSMMNTLTGEIMSPLARNVQTQSGYSTGQPQPGQTQQGLPAFNPAQLAGALTQPVPTNAAPAVHAPSQPPPPALAPATPWLPRVVVVASLFVAAGFLALRFTEQGQTLVLTRTGPAMNAPAPSLPSSGAPVRPLQGLDGREGPLPSTPGDAVEAAPAAQQHHVVVTLTTVPAGAYVWADDKPYGQTPANIEWWGDQAAPGREVRFTFQRDGYEKTTVVRSITGEKLDVEAVLNRVPFAPRRRPVTGAGEGAFAPSGASAGPSQPGASQPAVAPAGAPGMPAAAPGAKSVGPASGAKPAGDQGSHSGVTVAPDEFKTDPY